MSEYRVTATCVVVPIGPSRVLVERGGMLDRRVPLDVVERLVAKGMVAAIPAAPTPEVEPVPDPEPEPPAADVDTDPDVALEAMTVADLVEYAAASEIDLGGATRKADILATIQAAIAAE